METLLEIGRRLIEERGIDDCSMSEVAAAAGSSIGSLYFRFGNRERFISEVMQRQLDGAREQLEVTIARLEGSASADEAISGVVSWLFEVFARNKGLLRVQLKRTLEAPEVWRPYQVFAGEIVERTIALIAPFEALGADPAWKDRVRVALQVVIGTLNNMLINDPGPLKLDDGRAAEEFSKLTRAYLAFRP